jgi:DNA-binding protein H-NS
MISIATLNELQDAELRTTQSLITDILRKRDEDRKEKALEEARAIDARALNEKRAVLAAAGLTLKNLNGNGKKKVAKGPVYHIGHTYQHPTNKALVWNGKGKKPNWLVEIEADGKKPLEIA